MRNCVQFGWQGATLRRRLHCYLVLDIIMLNYSQIHLLCAAAASVGRIVRAPHAPYPTSHASSPMPPHATSLWSAASSLLPAFAWRWLLWLLSTLMHGHDTAAHTEPVSVSERGVLHLHAARVWAYGRRYGNGNGYGMSMGC